MNTCQISNSSTAYDTTKLSSSSSASQNSTDFRKVLQKKTSETSSDKNKTEKKQDTKKSKDVDEEKSKGSKTSNDKEIVPSDKFDDGNEENTSVDAASEILKLGYMVMAQDNALVQDNITDVNETVQTAATVDTAAVSNIQADTVNASQLSKVSSSADTAKENVSKSTFSAVASDDSKKIDSEDAKTQMTQDKAVTNNTTDSKKDMVADLSNKKASGEDIGQKASEKSSYVNEDNPSEKSTEEVSNMNAAILDTKDGIVNIKVAEPTVTKSWETATEEIGEAVVESIKGDKIEKLNISLNPRELGEIKVEFTMKDDKISVSLVCSNEKTKRLLAENSDILSKIVQTNLKQDTDVSVSYSEKNSGHQEEGRNENYDGRGGNGRYKEDSNQSNRHNNESDKDFLQKLRLGILEFDTLGV